MTDENSRTGTLSDEAAVAALMAGAMVEDDQTEEAKEDESEGIETTEDAEDDFEAAEVDDDAEGEDANDDDATVDDDTAEEIDADELKKGQLRHADYTRKTQELSAQRQQLGAERQQLEAQKQQFEAQAQQQLDALRAAVETYSVQTEAEPNWSELARTMEPKAYLAKQAEWSDKQAKRQEAAQLQEQMTTVHHKQVQAVETQRLLDRVPEWRDEGLLKEETAAIVEAASEYGYSKEEIAGVQDHRQVLILRELMLMKRAEKAAAKKKAKPVHKPKAAAAPVKSDPREKSVRNLTARLQKTGSVDDAAAILLAKAGHK